MSNTWKCPKCGAILKKGLEPEIVAMMKESTLVGTATCENCGSKFAQSDVYSGKYDVGNTTAKAEPVNTTPGNLDKAKDAVIILTYFKFLVVYIEKQKGNWLSEHHFEYKDVDTKQLREMSIMAAVSLGLDPDTIKITLEYSHFAASQASDAEIQATLVSYQETVDRHKDIIKPLGRGKGCFIATACCGSCDAVEVLILRSFRDAVLDKNSYGRCFVKVYYILSPPLARVIEKSPGAKRLIYTILVKPLSNSVARGADDRPNRLDEPRRTRR